MEEMSSVIRDPYISHTVLKDIFDELVNQNTNQLLRRKLLTKEDPLYRTYPSQYFILLRNVVCPVGRTHEAMFAFCRKFKLEDTVIHYAVELFDRLVISLIGHAMKNDFFYQFDLDINLNERFGANLHRMNNLRLRYDCLYLPLVDDYILREYGQIVVMAVCIMIASKQFELKHLRLSDLEEFLFKLNVPIELCQKGVIASVEVKLLKMIRFELNITTFKDYLDATLAILNAFIFCNVSEQDRSKIHSTASRLLEIYLILQIPFTTALFGALNDREFNYYHLPDIEQLENLCRDKLVVATAIASAACLISIDPNAILYKDSIQLFDEIVRFLATYCVIDYNRLYRCSVSAYKFLFKDQLTSPNNTFALYP